MNAMFNKKNVTISSIIIISLVIITMVYLNYKNSAQGISNEIETISSQNGWSTNEDFVNCQEVEDECIKMAYKLITAGIKNDLATVNYSGENIDGALSESSGLINKEQYGEAIIKIKAIIKDKEAIINSYSIDFKNIENAINGEVSGRYFTEDKRIISDWAIYNINNGPDTDSGIIILTKKDGYWKVAAGPGTFFTEDDLSTLSVPKEIIDIVIGNSYIPVNETSY